MLKSSQFGFLSVMMSQMASTVMGDSHEECDTNKVY